MQLESLCLSLLKEKGLTFASAESCTGGLIAKRITDLPGSSAVFMGGIVSYTNEVKHKVLGVAQNLLDTCGAVSEEVARSMAENARERLGADFGLSTTGVAGPDKDDRGNEVGTVYIALATKSGTFCRKMAFGDPGREAIRNLAADTAFTMLCRALRGLDPTEEN